MNNRKEATGIEELMEWKERAVKTLQASYAGKEKPDDKLLNCFVCGLNPALLEQEMKRIHDEAKESGRKEMLEEVKAFMRAEHYRLMEEDLGERAMGVSNCASDLNSLINKL